jgi:cell division protein FtsL
MNIQTILQFFQKNIALFAIGGVVFMELLWIILLQISLRRLKKKTGNFNLGETGAKIEKALASQSKLIKGLDKEIQELYNISNQINNLASRGLHKVAMMRFNPFKDIGGDQSFSTALLNGKNNGIVISSLYTREGTRVYSKAITSGKSEKYPLTEEEEQVVRIAMNQNDKKIN